MARCSPCDGIRRLVLPRRNEIDLDDVRAEVRAELEVILVDHMHEVLDAALTPKEVVRDVRAA